MKKSIVAFFSVLVITGSAYAQGTVLFVTRTLVSAPRVTDTAEAFAANPNPSGSTNLVGSGFYAQLFAADGASASEASLIPIGNLVNFRTAVNAGYVQESGTPAGSGVNVAVVTTVTATAVAGGIVTLQMRAWSSAFATYAAALTAFNAGNSLAHLGKSTSFNLITGGGLTPPADLIGLTAFQLVQVPEPSTIALGVMGILGAFFIRRRK